MRSECIDGLDVERGALLGRNRFLEVPQLEGLVLRGRDEDGLRWVEAKSAHPVKVAS